MRARFSELLDEAASRDSAVGAFTCYNLETAIGVLRAAEERSSGVILLVSEKSFCGPGGELLVAGLVACAERAATPACVQLDHVADLATIAAAFGLGAGAVLADGSKLPLDGNVALVRDAVEAASRSGGEVEAELGGIEGDEDVAAAVAAGALTDPDEAARFADRTGAACLAVSIGNVHGVYRDPPELDWPRLGAIRAAAPIPLSLHGASGLADADLAQAIRLGVRKVNVNTELRERYLAVTAERLESLRLGARVLDLNAAQTEAVAEAARAKLSALEGSGQR
jgi:tagatose 1,6-diphosphate aldolase GatY/KbaY